MLKTEHSRFIHNRFKSMVESAASKKKTIYCTFEDITKILEKLRKEKEAMLEGCIELRNYDVIKSEVNRAYDKICKFVKGKKKLFVSELDTLF